MVRDNAVLWNNKEEKIDCILNCDTLQFRTFVSYLLKKLYWTSVRPGFYPSHKKGKHETVSGINWLGMQIYFGLGIRIQKPLFESHLTPYPGSVFSHITLSSLPPRALVMQHLRVLKYCILDFLLSFWYSSTSVGKKILLIDARRFQSTPRTCIPFSDGHQMDHWLKQ